jgi:cardiolipin synthase
MQSILLTAILTALTIVIGWNFVRPEKKLQRDIRHRQGVRTPQFRRELSVLLGPPIVPGNAVRALQNGDQIFPEMLASIEGAQRTITFETYIYWSGHIGERFAKALAERARAGVKVRVTLDWMGSLKLDERLLQIIEEAGARVHRYRPLHWYNLGRINNRTHRKLLVIDGRIAFTGGVGIADQWEGHAQDPQHWRDVHFRVEGPVAAQFQAAFNDNWIKSTGEVLNGEEYFPALPSSGDIAAQLFLSSPAGGSESMHLMYLLSIAAAEKSIDLQAAYFVPDELALHAFCEALGRGVTLRLIVPGEHIDSDTVRVASRSTWGRLLEAGAEIHEYLPTMMHNKLLIVDRLLVSGGSTNFDIRSFRLNDEASLNVYDQAFAEEMTGVFERDLLQCRPYTLETWHRRPLRDRLVESLVVPIRSQL